MGTIITFYSYKGGVGRSMALVNVGVQLSRWGYNVLMVDWDLEAPGLENFFSSMLKEDLAFKEGLMDMLYGFINTDLLKHNTLKPEMWTPFVSSIIEPGNNLGRLDLITAGKRKGTDLIKENKAYYEKVRFFDVKDFYNKQDGGRILEMLRSSWKQEYDFVLVDSRTGITEIGGICTIQLPDILVLLFTATKASYNGIADVVTRAKKAHAELLVDRLRLLSLPILSRVDGSEKELTTSWIDKFIHGEENVPVNLNEIFNSWISPEIDVKALLNQTKIPHVAYYSFGEGLPINETDFETNVQGIGYSYLSIAGLLATKLNFPGLLINDRAKLLKLANKNQLNADQNDLFIKVKEELDIIPIPASVDDIFKSNYHNDITQEQKEWQLDQVATELFTNILKKSVLKIERLRNIEEKQDENIGTGTSDFHKLLGSNPINQISDHIAIRIFFRLKNVDKDILFLVQGELQKFINEDVLAKANKSRTEPGLRFDNKLSSQIQFCYSELAKNICDKLAYLLSDPTLGNYDDEITKYVIGFETLKPSQLSSGDKNMGLAQQFSNTIGSLLNIFAAWLPITNSYALGDFGVIADGIFAKIGNIKDFGIDFKVANGVDASIDFASAGTRIKKMVMGIEVNVIPESAINPMLVFEFESSNSFFIKAPIVRQNHLENVHELAASLKVNKRWRSNYKIVHQTYTAFDASIISTIDAGAKISFTGDAKALQNLQLGSSSVAITSSSKLGLNIIGEEGIIGLGLFQIAESDDNSGVKILSAESIDNDL